MRTNASIPRRQIGQDRRECPHGTHVAKWPHGMHANRFCSSRQRTHKLDDAESSAALFFSGCFVFSSWLILLGAAAAVAAWGYPSTVTESDDAVISTSTWSVRFGGADDCAAACSRARAATRGLEWTVCDRKFLYCFPTCHLFFTNSVHFNTRYNDVIFFAIDMFDLLLQDDTSQK